MHILHFISQASLIAYSGSCAPCPLSSVFTEVNAPWSTYFDVYAILLLQHKTLLHLSFLKFFIYLWPCRPTRVMASSFLRFLDYTRGRTIVGRTHLDERSARRGDLYLTTHNIHNKYPLPGRDSKLQSQQACGRRPTPQTAWATGTGLYCSCGFVLLDKTSENE
jgi:hypothetical protein